MQKYTTAEKVNAEKEAIALDAKIEPVEQTKTVISNDAYAVREALETLTIEIFRSNK
jgi:hypothetical protein